MNYEDYLLEKQKEAGTAGTISRPAAPAGGRQADRTQAGTEAPTLKDVFDKKTYYNPGKIRSRLQNQLAKYERQLAESEQKTSELQLQLMDPALATDYPKLMEIQNAIDAEEKNQESLLERMLETETELEEMQE